METVIKHYRQIEVKIAEFKQRLQRGDKVMEEIQRVEYLQQQIIEEMRAVLQE